MLRDRALNWFWEFQETYGIVDWDKLSEAMVQRFKIRRSDDDVRQLLERRKQRTNEPFLDYYHVVRSITLSLMHPLTDVEFINLLTRNMRGGLQAKFAGQQFQNITDMVNQCVTVEDIWSRIGWTPEIYHQTRSRQVNEVDVIQSNECNEPFGYNFSEQLQHSDSVCAVTSSPNDIYANKQRKPTFERPSLPNTCWNCLATGHFYKDCIVPIKHRFCFGCGTANILKTQCSRCNSYQKGNAKREFSTTGILSSQTTPNRSPSQSVEEVATNTDPELYRMILKRDTNTRKDN